MPCVIFNKACAVAFLICCMYTDYVLTHSSNEKNKYTSTVSPQKDTNDNTKKETYDGEKSRRRTFKEGIDKWPGRNEERLSVDKTGTIHTGPESFVTLVVDIPEDAYIHRYWASINLAMNVTAIDWPTQTRTEVSYHIGAVWPKGKDTYNPTIVLRGDMTTCDLDTVVVNYNASDNEMTVTFGPVEAELHDGAVLWCYKHDSGSPTLTEVIDCQRAASEIKLMVHDVVDELRDIEEQPRVKISITGVDLPSAAGDTGGNSTSSNVKVSGFNITCTSSGMIEPQLMRLRRKRCNSPPEPDYLTVNTKSNLRIELIVKPTTCENLTYDYVCEAVFERRGKEVKIITKSSWILPNLNEAGGLNKCYEPSKIAYGNYKCGYANVDKEKACGAIDYVEDGPEDMWVDRPRVSYSELWEGLSGIRRTEFKPNEVAPWLVLIRITEIRNRNTSQEISKHHWCTGSIVDRYWILTSKQCFTLVDWSNYIVSVIAGYDNGDIFMKEANKLKFDHIWYSSKSDIFYSKDRSSINWEIEHAIEEIIPGPHLPSALLKIKSPGLILDKYDTVNRDRYGFEKKKKKICLPEMNQQIFPAMCNISGWYKDKARDSLHVIGGKPVRYDNNNKNWLIVKQKPHNNNINNNHTDNFATRSWVGGPLACPRFDGRKDSQNILLGVLNDADPMGGIEQGLNHLEYVWVSRTDNMAWVRDELKRTSGTDAESYRDKCRRRVGERRKKCCDRYTSKPEIVFSVIRHGALENNFEWDPITLEQYSQAKVVVGKGAHIVMQCRIRDADDKIVKYFDSEPCNDTLYYFWHRSSDIAPQYIVQKSRSNEFRIFGISNKTIEGEYACAIGGEDDIPKFTSSNNRMPKEYENAPLYKGKYHIHRTITNCTDRACTTRCGDESMLCEEMNVTLPEAGKVNLTSISKIKVGIEYCDNWKNYTEYIKEGSDVYKMVNEWWQSNKNGTTHYSVYIDLQWRFCPFSLMNECTKRQKSDLTTLLDPDFVELSQLSCYQDEIPGVDRYNKYKAWWHGYKHFPRYICKDHVEFQNTTQLYEGTPTDMTVQLGELSDITEYDGVRAATRFLNNELTTADKAKPYVLPEPCEFGIYEGDISNHIKSKCCASNDCVENDRLKFLTVHSQMSHVVRLVMAGPCGVPSAYHNSCGIPKKRRGRLSKYNSETEEAEYQCEGIVSTKTTKTCILYSDTEDTQRPAWSKVPAYWCPVRHAKQMKVSTGTKTSPVSLTLIINVVLVSVLVNMF